jgi:phosphopantothenate---cysteine ligase (CTP)
MRFLVTAGNTREKIDQVRDWGNIFTGNTGLRLAWALAELGKVDLLTSNRAHVAELSSAQAPKIKAAAFASHAELRGALTALMSREHYDAVFMTAAVADYRPVRTYEIVNRETVEWPDGMERWTVRDVQAGKVKSSHEAIVVLGERTEKLVDLFRTEWRHRGLLVKFKLEVGIGKEELIRIGQASRKASAADYLVANTLDMVEGSHAGAFLLSDAGEEWVPRDQLASRLVRVVRERV